MKTVSKDEDRCANSLHNVEERLLINGNTPVKFLMKITGGKDAETASIKSSCLNQIE
jgi:hypothetical protein